MAARGEGFSACNQTLLPAVARLQNDHILQDIAVKSLDDPDPQVVGSAAAYLGVFGSAATENLLWARFTTWSERWKGHESELEYDPKHPNGGYEANAGLNLMQALATGHGWLTDEAKLRRLVDLSVGKQQKQQAQSYLSTWRARPWTINVIPFEPVQIEIGPYHEGSLESAKEKLAQFPRGTTFQLSDSGVREQQQTTLEELSRYASEHGLRVVPAHNQ